MRIINLFSVYIVILMVLHGLIAIFVDYGFYKKTNSLSAARKARRLGIFVIAISLVMYILKAIL